MPENRTRNSNSKKSKNCSSRNSKACRSESKSDEDDRSAEDTKPEQPSPLSESKASKSKTDVNSKKKVSKKKTDEPIPQENVIYPDVVPNTTYTNRVTPMMNPVKSAPDKSGAAAAAKNKDGIGVGGVVALLLIAAFIVFIIVVTANGGASSAQTGSIGGNTDVSYGKTSVLTYDIGDADLKPYDQVVWYVGDKEVQRKLYSDDGALTYEFDGETLGSQRVRVVAGGKIFCECDVNVAKPALNVNVDSALSIYGDELTSPQYSVEGFTEDDSEENYPEAGAYYTAYGDETETSPKNVGIYKIRLNHGYVNDAYDVNVNEGTLQILPREVTVRGNIVKDYDGTAVVENPSLKLVGVMDGDDVSVQCDKLYLNDKNAGGDKQYSLYNMTLTGSDAANYKIGNSDINVMIVPKEITVDELSADEKVYDGTNSATFTNKGVLNGVVNGDIVEVGDIEGYYSDVKVGSDKEVVINNIGLVGADSGNYTVKKSNVSGSINRFSSPLQERQTPQNETDESQNNGAAEE